MFGLPVIAANTSALKEIITNGRNGLLFTDGDASDLASQMHRILTNLELKEELSTQGKRTLEEGAQYSSTAMVEAYERFYIRIASA